MKNICVDERELIRRAKTGDTEAFAALLGLHERFVYNLALRTDAADIAQDAFVRAWMALHEFREQAQFRTGLYRIVLNLCINRLLRLRSELQNLTHEELIDIPETVYVAADPVNSLEESELQSFLHREIDRLPEQYRLLVSLRYQQSFPMTKSHRWSGCRSVPSKPACSAPKPACAKPCLFTWNKIMSAQPDELIENALRTYPLAYVPRNFSKRVMQQIQTPHAPLKFRLTWLDYALGLFLSILPAVGFVSWVFLPQQFFTRLQYQWLLLRSPAIEPIVITSLIAMVVLSALVLIVGIRFLIRPHKFSL